MMNSISTNSIVINMVMMDLLHRYIMHSNDHELLHIMLCHSCISVMKHSQPAYEISITHILYFRNALQSRSAFDKAVFECRLIVPLLYLYYCYFGSCLGIMLWDLPIMHF